MKNEWAYLAGYIDGDGCFYIGKNISPIKFRSGIIISSTKKNVLRFFKKTFNGNIIFDKKNPKFQKWSPVSQWYTGGENALYIIENISPFLVEKFEDAQIMKKFILASSKEEKENFIKCVKKIRNEESLVTSEEVFRINQLPCEGFDSQDAAYLAGFIDSECSLSLSRYKNASKPNYLYKSLLQCNNTKTNTIEYLKKKFGGFTYFVPRKTRNPLHKDQIAWRISASSLSKTLPHVLPFLKTKKEIAKLLIEYHSTVMPKGGDRHQHLLTYRKTLEFRDQIFHQISSFNSKSTI